MEPKPVRESPLRAPGAEALSVGVLLWAETMLRRFGASSPRWVDAHLKALGHYLLGDLFLFGCDHGICRIGELHYGRRVVGERLMIEFRVFNQNGHQMGPMFPDDQVAAEAFAKHMSEMNPERCYWVIASSWSAPGSGGEGDAPGQRLRRCRKFQEGRRTPNGC